MEELFGGWSTEIWLSRADELEREARLQDRVWEELRWEPLLDASGVAVAVEHGVVTLTGTVRSFPEKLAAARAAKRVTAVQAVMNCLEVTLPAESERSDADLSAAVLRALEWDVLVPDRQLKVKIAAGHVVLAGVVEREYQRAAAEAAVGLLTGARGVINRITLQPPAGVADLQAAVRGALRHRPGVCARCARDIEVNARGDTVVLRGRVHSLAERDEAEQAAWAVPGVRIVRGDLAIRR